jgi:hypothetical protein
MTAGSAAVSDLKESSVWGSWPDRRPWPGQETGGPLCAVRADLPGLCGGIGDACGAVPQALVPVGKDQGHQFCLGPLAWVARDPPTLQAGSGRAREMPPQDRLVRAAASA